LNKISEFQYELNKKEQITTVIKQLKSQNRIAEIVVTEQVYQGFNATTTLSIAFFDDHGNEKLKQDITIDGYELIINYLQLDFEYCKYFCFENCRLVLPTEILVNATNNKTENINIRDGLGVPYFYYRNEEAVFGMSLEDFNKNLEFISAFFQYPEKARLNGIKSNKLKTTAKYVKKGQVFTIYALSNGEIDIR